jgi:hypothetical protein
MPTIHTEHHHLPLYAHTHIYPSLPLLIATHALTLTSLSLFQILAQLALTLFTKALRNNTASFTKQMTPHPTSADVHHRGIQSKSCHLRLLTELSMTSQSPAPIARVLMRFVATLCMSMLLHVLVAWHLLAGMLEEVRWLLLLFRLLEHVMLHPSLETILAMLQWRESEMSMIRGG